RLSPEKRVNQLLDVWPAVRAAHPAATLLILGTGPQESVLRQQAGDGVLFCGRVDNVAPHLQASDLFVLPSATEGLSNALLEALAVGLPVIATNVGGAPDVVEHGHGGWLIPPDQPEQLQEALVTLLADPFQCRQFGQLARLRIERDYALPAVAQRLRRLYDSVLAAHGRMVVEPSQLRDTVPQSEPAEMYPANVPDEQRSHAA
ncbi:MAG: glycosyltransferase family 1 protein, partial [Chloroflexi bacterium]